MFDDDSFLEQLNREVRRYLKQTGTTKQSLADQLGCHRSTLNEYLTGDSPIPDDIKQQLTEIVGMHEFRLGPYLDWLEREYGYTQQLSITDEHVQLDLQQVHIPLRVVERDAITAYRRQMLGESHLEGVAGDRDGRSVFGLLSDSGFGDGMTTKLLLLLGEAGSGKTMTLRYAALRLASAYRANDPAQLADPTTGLHLRVKVVPLPIYVRLTLFAMTMSEDVRQCSSVVPDRFLTWIDQQAAQDCGLPEGILSGLIKRNDGGVMLLLDGLDETGERQREYLAQVIGQLARRYTNQRYLVASRTAGYGGEVVLPDFLERHLSPLNTEEAQKLLSNWFRTIDARLAKIGRRRQDVAADQVAQLWDVITHSEQLIEMATNPLLLTALALLQFNQKQLPDQRAKLYERLIELSLELWRKKHVDSAPSAAMTKQQSTNERRRLEALALAMQQQAQQVREVTLAQAQEWLTPWYVEHLGIDRGEANERVQRLLHRLSVDSGIIQRRDERYSFAHYTFQEYLAARALDALDQRSNQPGSVAFLLERSGEARWRETLLLAAGAWSSGQQWPKAERLLAGLLERGEPERVLLAGAILVDTGEIEELTQRRREVTGYLRDLAALTDRWREVAHPDPVVRNRAAMLLDRLNADRDRPGLDLTRSDYWTARIEPGMFSMGDTAVKDDEELQFNYTIHRPYTLARFPVTNRQYMLFVEALAGKGSHEAVVVAEQLLSLMEEHKQKPEDFRPRFWPGARYPTGEGNHPVVGMSWYAATAFAWWVDAWLHRLGLLKAGEEVRLPTEAEWERAVVYPLVLVETTVGNISRSGRRTYPWGNKFTATTTGDRITTSIEANTLESGIGGRSVVGIFPHGAAMCEAQELAGNVWEWCSTPYIVYPFRGEINAESPYTMKVSITYMLRGGSWRHDRALARCARRLDNNPLNKYDNFGFRLARLCSYSSS